MATRSSPGWLQRKLLIRGYKTRLADRLRREYGEQESYLPEQVEFCLRNEFSERRFGEEDWYNPENVEYAFALFCKHGNPASTVNSAGKRLIEEFQATLNVDEGIPSADDSLGGAAANTPEAQ